MIPKDDRGFTLGDGLFETILADRGRLVLWDAHVERLTRACGVIGLPAPEPRRLLAAAVAAVSEAGLGQARAAVRLTWTGGSGGRGLARPDRIEPRLVVSAARAPRSDGPLRLATTAVRRNEGSPASRLKSLSYMDNILARREADATGADEALMLNNAGEVACASVGNLFWLDGEGLCTPALDCGVLDGIFRAALIDRARAAGWTVREVHAGAEVLASAQGVFLTNSLIGLRPVSSLDGREIPQDLGVRRLAGLVADLCPA